MSNGLPGDSQRLLAGTILEQRGTWGPKGPMMLWLNHRRAQEVCRDTNKILPAKESLWQRGEWGFLAIWLSIYLYPKIAGWSSPQLTGVQAGWKRRLLQGGVRALQSVATCLGRPQAALPGPHWALEMHEEVSGKSLPGACSLQH